MDQLGINGWQLLIQLIAFLAFIWLLWKFAVGPIVNVLDQRQHRISESMAAAERMQAELRSTQARNEEVLLEARREAQDILSTARTNGEQMLTRAREEANTQAETYLTRAEESLRQEAEQARQLLRREVADLAVMAAGRIIRKELDPKAQTQLIEETLADASRVSTNGDFPGGAAETTLRQEPQRAGTATISRGESPTDPIHAPETVDVPVASSPVADTGSPPPEPTGEPGADAKPNQSSVSYRPSRNS
ncbi:MAG: hypothetical protein AVDCRST_MAG87-2033 [uncultured Thermomicrobiales bacterium]|uniref:ATP synthase subunit b n=1 Tax=uncultured Thermomicrobiales bacterium TaxID=1645740 RepID=A0A6J4V281_9BACT|nr:MAG: hypothetical protein AVDCRST_MAG87-2033 [uncultured Thermomicrobiales bacterium]